MRKRKSKNTYSVIALLIIVAIAFITDKLQSKPAATVDSSAKVVPTKYEKTLDKTSDNTATVTSTTEKSNVGTEIPYKLKGTPERILHRTAYTTSFNRNTNQPNWVAWCLTAAETSGTISRDDEFYEDPNIPLPHRVNTNDYKGSGYDRGHMAPAADMKFNAVAMKECFYMSNICPQKHELNSGDWKKVETACRRWAKKYGEIYIVCGPVFYGGKHKSIGKEHSVTVPDAFFKCIYSECNGNPQAIAFLFNNSSARQNMFSAAINVDKAEEITGMNFFYMLPDKIEEAVEKSYNIRYWQ